MEECSQMCYHKNAQILIYKAKQKVTGSPLHTNSVALGERKYNPSLSLPTTLKRLSG